MIHHCHHVHTCSNWGCGLQVRSSIPIQCVCAVERVDENAFQQQNVMQVITQDNDGQLHTTYIQCKVRLYTTQLPRQCMSFFKSFLNTKP